MKRIILGISVLLLLVQNGFAYTNAEYDRIITSKKIEVNKQMWKCNKASNIRNAANSDVNICLKAIELIQKDITKVAKDDLSINIGNAGLIYDESGDKLNGYKYYMKAAKLGGRGGIQAQKNLNIMCKESPWACK